jgi:serine/threonine-protein kinase RsbW
MMIRLDIPNIQTLEETDTLVGRLAKAVGFDEDSCDDICFAVHEAVVNAIQHGNEGEEARHVTLQLVLHPDRLEISIRDQGLGFDPGGVPNPLTAENLSKPSGRGIHLMRALMDDVSFRRLAGGMEVTMLKRLPPATRTTGSSQTSDDQCCMVEKISN